MSDDLIFREVDEDVRRDRMEAVWKRYGAYALGGALLIVAIVAGSVFWKDYQLSERHDQGAAFEAAYVLLQDERYAEAAEAFEALAADGNDGYRVLASMQAVSARALAGEGEAALSAYDRMLDSGVGDATQQHVIRLKAAMLALELQGGDAAIERLNPLIEGDGPFRNAAREARALALISKGDNAGAIAELKAVAEDPDTPEDQRSRVSRFLLSLGG